MFRSAAWCLACTSTAVMVFCNFFWSGKLAASDAGLPPRAKATDAPDAWSIREPSAAGLPAVAREKGPADGRWDYPAIRREFGRILARIKEAPVMLEPFPHIEVPELVSDSFYAALMAELPPVSEYKPSAYAGTAPTYDVIDTKSFNMSNALRVPEECREDVPAGADKRCYFKTLGLHDKRFTTGLVFKSGKTLERSYPLWARMYQLVHSLNFTRVLVEKFTLSQGAGIPEWKRVKYNLTHGSLKNSVALRIEPSHYHLTPHIDIMEKLITWQYFHPKDTSLGDRRAGTQFYRPKVGVNMEVNDRANPQWLDYDLFDFVSEQRVLPNYFFAFAPNGASWHGASLDPGQLEGTDEFARRTFLGFITAGDSGFHPFRKPQGDAYLD